MRIFIGPICRQVRELILSVAHANPLWRAPRIHGELLKLGILERAAWVNTKTNVAVPIRGSGILITRNMGIKFVEFLEGGESKPTKGHVASH